MRNKVAAKKSVRPEIWRLSCPAPVEFREELVGYLDDIDIPRIDLPPLRHADEDLDRILDNSGPDFSSNLRHIRVR